MAKAAKTAPKTDAKTPKNAVPGPIEVETGDVPDALAYINSLLASNDGIEWDVRVYQVIGLSGRGTTGKEPFLFNISVEEIADLEGRLAEQYPEGGVFRVMVRADMRLVKRITVEIAKRPGYRAPIASYRPAAEQQPQQQPDRLELFMERMIDQQQRFMETVAATLRAAPAAPVGDQITSTLALMKAIREASPAPDTNLSLTLFERGLSMAEKFQTMRGAAAEGGAGEAEITLLSLARDFLTGDAGKALMEGIAPMLQGKVQQQQPPQVEGPRVAAPIIAGPLSNPQQRRQTPRPRPPQPAPEISEPDQQMAMAMQYLIERAAAGADPAMVAEWIEKNVPPNILEHIEQQENVVDYLASQFPDVNQHRTWFEAVVANIWVEEEAAPELPNPEMQHEVAAH
jgi:hypothetical protein